LFNDVFSLVVSLWYMK